VRILGQNLEITHRRHNRATKRLPALARKFMDTAQREMGVTVFMLVQYRNEDGNGSLSK
jgi:ribosome-associated translation inhibitor RaiA